MRVLHTHAIFWVSRIILRYHPILPSLFVLLPYQMIAWFIDSGNKTGCRFVVVDAYNEERPIRYYQKCGFDFLIPDKTAELKYTRNTVIKDAVDLTEPKEEDAVFLDTRLMFFDLIRLRC